MFNRSSASKRVDAVRSTFTKQIDILDKSISELDVEINEIYNDIALIRLQMQAMIQDLEDLKYAREAKLEQAMQLRRAVVALIGASE